jgi:transmembrane sensor
MDYRTYSAEDFALDEKFQQWVLDPSPEVNGFWERWVRDNPTYNSTIKEAIDLVKAAGLSKDKEANVAYVDVWRHLRQNAEAESQKKRTSGWQITKVAAVLAFVIVGSFVLWRAFRAPEMIVYRTGFNEVKEFTLEDGSRVMLNSNSRLSFAPGWNDKSIREVALEGEGFFDVVHTKEHKGFEVTTNEDIRISVLGTKFNVNTRHEEVQIYLESGKVKVNSVVGEAMMSPGDFVFYRSGNAGLMLTRKRDDIPRLLSWKEEMFVFNDTPLAEVVREIEDHFGFNVVLEDQGLNEKRITAKVPRGDVNVLLSVLSETLNIQIVQDGNTLTLK